MADDVFKDAKWIVHEGYTFTAPLKAAFIEVGLPLPKLTWRSLQEGEGFSIYNPETFPAPTVLDIYAPRITPGMQRDPRDAEIERLQEEVAYWRDEAEARATQIRAERLMRSPDPYYVTVDSRGVIVAGVPGRPQEPKPAPRFLVDAEKKPKRKFRL